MIGRGSGNRHGRVFSRAEHQHGNGNVACDAIGDAPEPCSADAGASMRRHDDEIDVTGSHVIAQRRDDGLLEQRRRRLSRRNSSVIRCCGALEIVAFAIREGRHPTFQPVAILAVPKRPVDADERSGTLYSR